MNKPILDTDIFSEINKGVDATVAAHAKAYLRAFRHDTISAVTVMEIVRGDALPTAEVLPFDTEEAELAGRIAGELQRTGRPIEQADRMIAAIAIEHRLELVTGNTAHDQRIQQLGHPLTLVNWRL